MVEREGGYAGRVAVKLAKAFLVGPVPNVDNAVAAAACKRAVPVCETPPEAEESMCVVPPVSSGLARGIQASKASGQRRTAAARGAACDRTRGRRGMPTAGAVAKRAVSSRGVEGDGVNWVEITTLRRDQGRSRSMSSGWT